MNDRTDYTALISNMQHFSTGDGPGIRSTVFFQGCNLNCLWCHNPETLPSHPVLLFYSQQCTLCGLCSTVCTNGVHSFVAGEHVVKRASCKYCGKCVEYCRSKALALSGSVKSAEEVMNFILEDIDFYKASGGGVTLSGGEPLLQASFCATIAKECKNNEIHIIIDTAGNVDYTAFEKVIPFTDLFYFDLKGVNEKDYQEKTGGSLILTLRNITRLRLDGANVTVRIPIIPDYNDNIECCRRIIEILKTTGVIDIHLLPFHRLGSGKYKAIEKKYVYKSYLPVKKDRIIELQKMLSQNFKVKIEG